MFIPVEIPCCEKLSTNCVVEPSIHIFQEKNIAIMPCLLHNSGSVKYVSVHNFNDIDAVIYPKIKFGVCESYYEKEIVSVCHSELSTTADDQMLPDYLKDLLERSSNNLTAESSANLARLLCKYQSVFAKSSDDLGKTNLVQHQINTGNAAPIRQPPRRLPFGKRQIEKDEINKMLERGVIEPSTSAWSSPIVLMAKKDGSTRFCVDYRKLNYVTVKDAYPLPRIDECLYALSSAKWFGCMDLSSAFWQLSINDSDKEKTAFSTSQGLYQFRVMPYGLATAPTGFKRLMKNVLRGLQWEECLLYMDDIIVPASTIQESLQRLENVFKRLLEAGLKLKPSNCLFVQKSIKFLGHIVSETGIHTDPEKTEAIQKWPQPKNQKQMRSFLGLCSPYRRFVQKCAEIARPLHQLCGKSSVYQWTSQCEEAFKTLKEALMSPPILGYPKMGSKFILDTDPVIMLLGQCFLKNRMDKKR